MDPRPIFFLWTRSFWSGLLSVILSLADPMLQLLADAGAGPPIAGVIAGLFGADPATVETTMRVLAPLFAIFALQQRAHAARPYTLRATRDTLT